MHYSKIIITNLPSFYKINLYNKINEKKKIFVVFTGDTASIRKKDFFKGNINFDHINLENKSTIKKIIAAHKIISTFSYNELIACGLNELINWFCVFYSPRQKNATVVESSYYESTTSGLKGFIKKLFFKRISTTYASGIAQEKLAKGLGFKGKMVITKGVGIFNIIQQPEYIPTTKVSSFIYVGRLSEEKNLKFLINIFNKHPQYILNIIGYGPEEEDLKSGANHNIKFLGAIDNGVLPELYQKNDVFILPSIKEPWGLVVEEALNNGLPVIISNKVGCVEEIIKPDFNGLSFDPISESSLISCIEKITNVSYYNQLKQNISKLDFNETVQYQVNCYI